MSSQAEPPPSPFLGWGVEVGCFGVSSRAAIILIFHSILGTSRSKLVLIVALAVVLILVVVAVCC